MSSAALVIKPACVAQSVCIYSTFSVCAYMNESLQLGAECICASVCFMQTCACWCLTKAHYAIIQLPVVLKRSASENHRYRSPDMKSLPLSVFSLCSLNRHFGLIHYAGFLSQRRWGNFSCKTQRNQKEEEEGQEEDVEVMDTTDENCSPVIVTNGGEFILKLLYSLFTSVL